MKILMVCSEFAPLAKTGGLADAVTGLCNALCARGHDVRVLLPQYAHLDEAGVPLDAAGATFRYSEVPIPAGGGAYPVRAPRVYLFDLGELTATRIYTGDARDAGRFMQLAAAALALCDVLDWQPDVVHCHDWHAALAPVLLRSAAATRPPPSVLTLHNVGYQGAFPAGVLDEFGMPELRSALPADALRGGFVNFLRAGLHAAGVVTTVSPTYATEIRTPAFGMGLEDVLNARGDAVIGILNGVDYDVWDPRHDPFLDTRFDAGNLAPKQQIKRTLAARLGLTGGGTAPLVGVVSRLATQKGIDLVTAVLPTLLGETRADFVFLGSGDAPIAAELTRLANEHPRRFSFTDGYDEALAHRIFAGCDLTLVPSRYEPCGLTQMYALRYGTIPVVRATGGLADTIRHYDPVTGEGNGSVFRDADPQGLLWGIRSALTWFDDPATWSRLVANAMAEDFSWAKQVPHYEQLYRDVIAG